MIQTKNLQYKSFPFQQKYQEVSAVPGTGLESTHSTTSKSGCAPITAAAASLSLGLMAVMLEVVRKALIGYYE